MKNTTRFPRRLLSWLLIFAALLGFMPAVSHVSAAQEVTIYFSDTDGWGNVNGYVWDSTGNLMGDWPGTALSKASNGLYVLKVNAAGAFSFIFNNGTKQTGDLSLTASQISGCNVWCVSGGSGKPAKYAPPTVDGSKVTFTYEGSGTNVYLAGSFNGWSSSANKMTKSGSKFTCTLELAPGKYEYKLVKDGSWINDPGNPLITGSDNNNYFIMPGMADTTVYAAPGETTNLPAELPCTAADGSTVRKAVTYTLKAVSGVSLKGNALTVSSSCTASKATLTAATADGYSCTVTANLSTAGLTKAEVTVHFINSLGWDGVCAYGWSSGSTLSDSWPGKAVQRGADGEYVLNLTHRFAAGETLGLIFHNNKGVQTADITVTNAQLKTGKVELWVQPSATGTEGKHPVTVTTSKAAQFISTEINGDQVTFRYKGSASSVYLAGTFNNWSKTANKLTKSGSTFSTTVTLKPGIHEYKFIVDGEWICDPGNGLTGGYDGNSVLVVPSGDAPVDTGKITVKLHFYRSSGAYSGWDVWYWANGISGSAATLATVSGDKGRVATFTVDGKLNSNVGYVVRKTDWSDKEFYDRFIDLSDISSGTVHFFLNAGSAEGSRILDSDVVMASKITGATLDYTSGKIAASLSMPYEGALSSAFSISGPDSSVKITGIEPSGSTVLLSLSRKLKLSELPNYKIVFNSTKCDITTKDLFYSAGFAAEYTYNGDDLGATWSKDSTTFKVWAPTAKNVHLKLYKSGNYGTNDQLQYVQMKQGDKGVWYVTVTGDLHGKYYNYDITFDTYTVEATDPYAKACGANGDRGMIVDLDATDPEGWSEDISPNKNMSYTDAIIYEMHIREMTIDSTSGVKSAWRGKYLGLTQDGTSYNGYATGLAHLKELGITHVQLMPAFDFKSVDEYHLTDWQQYAWGYDPQNYNVPEGGYATDPFNGTTRISEFKTMVHTFHENGINVVMDVVYNHTFDGGNYCGNKIVPNYYSRFFGEGNWSNGSGCGNDFATERSMVRNLIVDSVFYWVEEYHIDGFRFDLAGLIDTQTINEIVNTVHAKYPHVMFYGEGWASGGTAVEYGYDLATQGNAWQTPGFAHFNDGFRNDTAGNNGNAWGFTVGDWGKADAIGNYFRASNGWSTSPSQTVNYVSCHDNYCLTDKILISQGTNTVSQDIAKRNMLSNAIVMLSQGIPFLYSGDELLREKKDASGNRYDNAYGTNDYINKIRWSDLKNKNYVQMTDDYYAGLVAFRKNHAALRCPNGSDAWNYTKYHKVGDQTVLFNISGYPNYECSDGIVVIFNASTTTQYVDLYKYDVPTGTWNACIHGTKAGTDSLWSMSVTGSSGTVGVEPLSATVLVLGDLVDENSVYNQNLALVQCKHPKHNTQGICSTCGAAVEHSWSNGKCGICGKSALAITKQPTSVTVASGKTAAVSISATGEGLTYAWYYKNAGATSFTKSSTVTGNTYSVGMTASRSGRQLYCVVTDKYGNSVKSNTVTLTMTAPALSITKQPVSVSVPGGQTAKITFTATGEGLTYKWYYKNKGASAFALTKTFTGNTYTAEMNATRDGRQIYCLVTDKYGNTVQTDVVTISMKSTLAITQQPQSVTVAKGQTAKVTFTATGEGLTYKWYYKNKGASAFALTKTFTGNTYTAEMNATRNGRQIYCVVTDKYGNSVKTDVVTLNMAAVAITRQPVSVTAAAGSKATVSFTALGEGLTYKWYYADKGSDTFKLTTSFTTNVYSLTMTAARAGRRIYCVVTDKNGNTAKTDVVTLNMGTPLAITKQPVSVAVASGASAKVTVQVQGEGLTFQWYYASAGSDAFKLTTAFRSNSYTVAMNDSRNGRRLYCVITDKFGNSVTTEIVTISMK